MEIQRLLSSEAIINKSTLVTLSSSINSGIEKVAKNMENGHRIVRMDLENLSTRFDLAMANSTARTSPIVSDDGVGLFISLRDAWLIQNQFRIIRQDQVILGRSLRTLPNAFIYRGKFLNDQGLAKVVIKKYNPTNQGRQVEIISSAYKSQRNLFIYIFKRRNLKTGSIFGRRTCKPFEGTVSFPLILMLGLS